MKQFQVPQFITVEDKVIGPFTLKQFLYLAGGGGVALAAYMFLHFALFLLAAAIVGSLAGALAFLKVNEQPFPIILKNAMMYLIRPRLYIWKKEDVRRAAKPEAIKQPQTAIQAIPKLSQSKLTDLAWSLDIKEKLQE